MAIGQSGRKIVENCHFEVTQHLPGGVDTYTCNCRLSEPITSRDVMLFGF